MPLYAVYVLLFADTGLSEAQISLLFILWSGVAVLSEVPSGALADRFSRRGVLVASSLFQALGYALWILFPGFASFAAGFILWGFGGALVTGAFEALLYEGLVERGAGEHYVKVNSAVNAVGLLGQLPSAGLATLLYWAGGYALVGWVSIGVCAASSLLATRLPEPHRTSPTQDRPGYLTTLRIGIREALGGSAVRPAVLAVALIGAMDGLEEYFPLMARVWGIPTGVIPLAVLGLPLAGAAGAALGGRANRLAGRQLAAMLVGALVVLGAMGLIAVPAGLAGVAFFWAIHQMVLVVADARLQERIEGPARATVTSVASLGTELVGIGLFAAWAVDGLMLVVALWLLIALALPKLLRRPAF
ncbi:MAG TPA: MFS transporter [Actinomycetota bacterium]|nr:MFS transporter [Actinomycetota bacterium]